MGEVPLEPPHRRRRTPTPAWLVAALSLLVGGAFAEESPLTLEQALDKALARNPGLAEIRARAAAMKAIPPQAGALPDPTLSFDLLNVPVRSFDLRREDMTMMEVGISQTLPFPGKRALQARAAQQEALAAADSVDEARLRLAREVKAAWWNLFYLDRALAITRDSEKLLLEMVETAQSRYRVGRGEQAEVLMAQLELSKLKDERLEWIGMRHGQTAQFNVLTDRAPEQPVVLPAEAKVVLPVLVESQLQEKAGRLSPRFARRRNMLEAAKARVDLAEQDYYPDFTVGAGYGVRQNSPAGDSRSDFASFRLSMNLPLYADRKQAMAVDQRRSELLQEQYSFQDEHHRTQAEIAAKTAEYDHIKDRMRLLEQEIVPQARLIAESLLARYRVGRTAFSDLLRAELGLFRYQTQYWQFLAQTQQLLAELTALVGEEVAPD